MRIDRALPIKGWVEYCSRITTGMKMATWGGRPTGRVSSAQNMAEALYVAT